MRSTSIVRSVPAIALAAFLIPGGLGLLHLHLTRSEPDSKQVLSASPSQIRLWFSETPVVQLSTITVLRSDSTKVQLDPVKAVDDSSVAATVKETLGPGDFTVVWRATSGDGHVVRGRYGFSIGTDTVTKPSSGAP